MTSKQEKQAFAKARSAGKNRKQAALIAKPDLKPQSAAVTGHRLDNDPEVKLIIQKTAQQALADHGLSIDDFIQTIKEARTANKVIVMGKNTDDSFVDVVPDWGARLKATEMGLKLLQAYTPNKQPDTPDKPQLSDDIKKKIANGDLKAIERLVFNDE